MSEDKITFEDWFRGSRLKTSVPGVFILKMPICRNSPTRLTVELNPVDSSGSPTKKRGLVLRSKQEVVEFKELFQFDKLMPLPDTLDKVNPEVKKHVVARQGEDTLQI